MTTQKILPPKSTKNGTTPLTGKGSKTNTLLSEATAQTGRKVINVAAWAGDTITLRVVGAVSLKAKNETPQIGIGDIYYRRKQ